MVRRHLNKEETEAESSVMQRSLSNGVISLVVGVERGLMNGVEPELVSDCCGGTYILRSESGERIGIFKPADEEPYAPNNPKGFVGSSMHKSSPMKGGIDVGQAAVREWAAYLLDGDKFVCVPDTTILRILHVSSSKNDDWKEMEFKYGSLQKFIEHDGCAEDYGCTRFDVDDVHRLAIFDIQVINTDR
jgi:hypothetical protein